MKPDEEPEIERFIDDNFNLDNTTWYFQQVAGKGFVLGSQRSDVDNNPTGFAQFNSDGTGIFDFKIDMLGQPYEKIGQPIEWERLNKEQVLIVEIEEWERDTFYWELLIANENIVQASWDIRVLDNFATITTTLKP